MKSTSINSLQNDRIASAGQVIIEKITITTYSGVDVDVLPQILELIIDESMYSNFITGRITLIDNVNMVKYLPIVGDETLTVQFRTPSLKNIVETFKIYKIQNKIETLKGNKQSILALELVTPDFIINQQTKISLSFENQPIHTMVRKIFDQYFNGNKKKSLLCMETSGTKTFTFPYKAPNEIINWLSKRSISQDSKQYTYLFFENLSNFIFAPMNFFKELNSEPVAEYSYYRLDGKNFIDIDLNRITDYNIITTTDTAEYIQEGLFSSKLIKHDITYKTIEEHDYDYYPEFYDRLKRLNPFGILPATSLNKYIGYNYSDYSQYTDQSYAYDNIRNTNDYEKIVQLRKAHLVHYNRFQIEIIVPGNSERRTGEIIDVNFFSDEPFSNKKAEYDPILSGTYLITGITHFVQNRQYYMKMRIQRDSTNARYPDSVSITEK